MNELISYMLVYFRIYNMRVIYTVESLSSSKVQKNIDDSSRIYGHVQFFVQYKSN